MPKSTHTESDPFEQISNLRFIECGKEAATHFAFEDGYINLNHGSYGTYPVEVRSVFRYFQERTEAAPDAFVRYEYRTRLLDESRGQIAKYLNAPIEDCVLVQNSSTAFDTIVRNLVFNAGDVIVCFANIYESFENTLIYISETTQVEVEKIDYFLPVSDDYICETFETTVKAIKAQGKTLRLAVFDTISSLPAVRMPFERLTQLCRIHGILSCIDGAHGIGHLAIDMRTLNPDFFMSNAHKWLHVPRPCAVLFVPSRNQHLMRATLPVGFAFTPLDSETGDKKPFVSNFASVGTLDDTPYICIEAALKWRDKLTWRGKRGEQAIMGYVRHLAHEGGHRVSSILQTEILDNNDGSLSNCGLINIRLPLSDTHVLGSNQTKPEQVSKWIMKTMILQYRTAVNVFFYNRSWWARLCAQVYLVLEDFERAGLQLKSACERAAKGEWNEASDMK